MRTTPPSAMEMNVCEAAKTLQIRSNLIYVDTQGSQATGDTLVVVEDSLDNFAGARPEPMPMMGPGEVDTVGAGLVVEEVINL
jgi:hypothetical protein